MRFFIVLSVILSVGYAAPQYGYEQPIPGHIANVDNGSNGVNRHGNGGEKYLPPATTTPAPIVHKQFYVISAPEDNGNKGKQKHLVLGRPQRNYRVVFIKAPGSDNGNVKYSAEFAPQEEKTVIYVLSKKDNDLDANDIATPPPTQPSKPEVFFIKYKTDDEAQQAQKEIQGQYDKLGGTNEFSDEGTAPVTSVIGSLDSLNGDGSYNYRPVNSGSADLSEPIAPSSQYLPSFFKH
ncbi:uncharacterized protein LOC119673334 [Teleopsis dalmanni]|uniref:uncharacterized protein LOC119673334 n=1 Tax=Teleopsis dalmanni TaxID=139649 RepID=UPI0018CCC8B2|nr:uncharacterized protein LOC119673334 [Teleopsis dalmanni]